MTSQELARRLIDAQFAIDWLFRGPEGGDRFARDLRARAEATAEAIATALIEASGERPIEESITPSTMSRLQQELGTLFRSFGDIMYHRIAAISPSAAERMFERR